MYPKQSLILAVLFFIFISLHLSYAQNPNHIEGEITKNPEIVLSDSLLQFANTEIGNQDTLYLTIFNRGDTLLHINMYSNREDFIPAFSDSSVTEMDSIRLPVYFNPSQRGLITGGLMIFSNDTSNTKITVDLQGKGIAPEIYAYPDPLDFGVVARHDTVQQMLFVTNHGELPLHITRFYLADTSSAYTISASKDTVLEPFSIMAIRVSYAYKDQMPNVFEDTLNIESNDPLNPVDNVRLIARTYRMFKMPQDFPTIQSAIDSIWAHDTLLVARDTYNENIKISGKNIVLISNYYFSKDGNDITKTIINGNSEQNTVRFSGRIDSSMLFSGFTVQNGGGLNGGGIYINSSSPTLEHLIITDNKTTSSGGGLYLMSSSSHLRNVTIQNNQSGAAGGGLAAGGWTPPLVKHLMIKNNQSKGNGGGLFLENGINLSLDQVQIVENTAQEDGGGIACNGTEYLNIDQGLIAHNRSEQSGGGISAIMVGTFEFHNTTFSENSCEWSGGGLDLDLAQAELSNCLIQDNWAKYGGGALHSTDIQLKMINCTVPRNSTGSTAGALLFESNDRILIFNSIIWDNSPRKNESWEAEIFVSHCDIESGRNGFHENGRGHLHWLENNLNKDPLYLSYPELDYHLVDASPCIGAGALSVTMDNEELFAPGTDMEGEARPNPQDSPPDLGALENSLGIPLGIERPGQDLPLHFSLLQNYPNPFGKYVERKNTSSLTNSGTYIPYDVHKRSHIRLTIYNTLGQVVRELVNKDQNGGHYNIFFNASGLASGVYIYRLTSNRGFCQTRKMILIR